MKTAVVTGASQGIGLAIAQALTRDGHAVVGVDRTPCAHSECSCVVGDVRDGDVLRAADEAAIAIGPLACWVNNAAEPTTEALHVATTEGTRAVLDVTLEATYWGCSVAVRRFMAQRSGGSIVNVSSIQATHAFPGWAAYVTAKGGVDALTRYIAVEYGALGIRANAVAPGNIRTPLLEAVIANSIDPAAVERSAAGLHPMGRVGLGADVAGVVAFLARAESGFVTGQVIAVDGGATARCYPMPLHPDVTAHLAESERDTAPKPTE
jgi:NAD(P)-dependent dehydrogenase (short-subunit alcohol dehydrogenase family)